MSEVKYYRVFGRRMISEPMLIEQMRDLGGQSTVAQMAVLMGLGSADAGKLLDLCKQHDVPFRPTLAQKSETRRLSSEQREAAKRVASAAACRMAEIEQARTAAATAPRYKRGPLVW